MGARGAMAPTNFEKDAFGTHDGTHEILKSPFNGTHVFKFPTHPLEHVQCQKLPKNLRGKLKILKMRNFGSSVCNQLAC